MLRALLLILNESTEYRLSVPVSSILSYLITGISIRFAAAGCSNTPTVKVITYNSAIAACERAWQWTAALQLFVQMRKDTPMAMASSQVDGLLLRFVLYTVHILLIYMRVNIPIPAFGLLEWEIHE